MIRHIRGIIFYYFLSGTLPDHDQLCRGGNGWEGEALLATEHYTLGNSQQWLLNPYTFFLELFSANLLPFLKKAHLPCLFEMILINLTIHSLDEISITYKHKD